MPASVYRIGGIMVQVLGVAVVAAWPWAAAETLPDAVAVFQDPTFERGFMLTAARHPAPKVYIGTLQTTEEANPQEPAWHLAQWGTRHLLEPGKCVRLGNGVWQAETPGKRVELERLPDGSARLVLEVRGGAEYGGAMRKRGEPWPHLLIEQRFPDPVLLQEASALPFSIEMRIPHCVPAPWAEGKLDPGDHTAQVSAFWTVHNVNAESPDHQEMIWFGIPLFDARMPAPGPHYALDTAVPSGKFICTLDGRRFWEGHTGDGAWRTLEVDLVPLLQEALAISQERGYMESTRLEDLALTTFNLGWEAPGPYDAALEIRGLSLLRRPRAVSEE